MKRWIAIIIAIYSPALIAQTPTESVSTYEHNIIEYRFVGLTPETTIGEIQFEDSSGNLIEGVAAMHRLCQKSYGNEARGATIQEAFFRNEKHKDKRSAWVLPSGPISVLESTRGYIAFDAATGAEVGRSAGDEARALASSYCYQYTSGLEDTSDPAYWGPVSYGEDNLYGSRSTINTAACDTLHAVACSIPVRITAKGLTKVTNGNYRR